MSVIVTVRIKADANKLETWAAANKDSLHQIREKAKNHGAIAHRFYSDGNGNVIVIDEWPDRESFQAFFSESQADVGPLMAAASAQGEPEVSFLRELQTGDAYGWGA